MTDKRRETRGFLASGQREKTKEQGSRDAEAQQKKGGGLTHGSLQKERVLWIDYYADGQRHRRKISPRKNVATFALKDVQVKISKGEYLGIYEEKKVFFKDMAEKTYIPYAKANLGPRTFYRCEGIIKTHLIPFFGRSYVFKIGNEGYSGLHN